MRRNPAFVLIATGVLFVSACGTNRNRKEPVAPLMSATGSRVVTREMIVKWNVSDAYQAIERGGGYKLASSSGGGVSVSQRRGPASIQSKSASSPVLLIDGAMVMDYSMLRQIRASQIERIDFLSPSDATQRFGTTSSGAGAIIVSTRGSS
ncbi:MAG: TonB-dependent receptor plug domain-containing protein [Gemmatimonadaceae bacterium]